MAGYSPLSTELSTVSVGFVWNHVDCEKYALLYLQVSVHYAHGVQIVNCIQNLSNKPTGIHLCVETFLHDAVEQLPSRNPAITQKSQCQVQCNVVILPNHVWLIPCTNKLVICWLVFTVCGSHVNLHGQNISQPSSSPANKKWSVAHFSSVCFSYFDSYLLIKTTALFKLFVMECFYLYPFLFVRLIESLLCIILHKVSIGVITSKKAMLFNTF